MKNIKIIGRQALSDGLSYLIEHPAFLLRAALNAARLRIGIPIEALRWLAGQFMTGPRAPGEAHPASPGEGGGAKAQPPLNDVELLAAAPALRLRARVGLMGTPLLVDTEVHFAEVTPSDEHLLLGVRLRRLGVEAPEGSPARQMLAALDLSRPGNLIMFMPRRPPALHEAHDDLFVFDLFKIKKIGHNPLLRRALLALSEVITVADVRVEGDLLVIALRAQPLRLPAALQRLRQPAPVAAP